MRPDSSVVDDVDAGLDPVPCAGRGDHGTDGLGHAAASADDPAHVVRGHVDAKAEGTPSLFRVDDDGSRVGGDRN